MATEIWAAIIGVVGTLVGALGGAYFGSKLSKDATRHLIVLQAYEEFSAAFTDTLLKLRLGIAGPDEAEGMQILKEDYQAHLHAYLKFRSILPSSLRKKLETAWREYTKDDDYDDQDERETYRFCHVLAANTGEHELLLAEKHINALLIKSSP